MTIASHVPQPSLVAGLKNGRKLVGWPRRLSNGRQDVLALGTVELLFHLCEGGSYDIVMMHVGSDRLDGVEPHAMNQIEIASVVSQWFVPYV
jgi:hypothetical protein